MSSYPSSTLQRVLGCVEEAEQYVSQLAGEEKVTESVWFMKVSWNTALQSGNNYNEMRRAFQACYRVSSYLLMIIYFLMSVLISVVFHLTQ